MRTLRTLTLSLALAVAAFALVATPVRAQDADIVETAQQADGFETLVAALQAADLVEALKGDGPFTVFAPTDEAFANLPEGTLENLLKEENKGQLQKILQYHVVSGKVMAEDVMGIEEAETLAGDMVGVSTSDGSVMLSGQTEATVVQTDIEASNGVIHVIDTVLLPPEDMEEDDMEDGDMEEDEEDGK